MDASTPAYFHTFNTIQQVQEYVKRADSELDQYGKYNFEQCLFDFEIDFGTYLGQFDSIAYFANATFSHDVSFKGVKFSGSVDFSGCTFKGITNFDHATFEADATMGWFENEVSFRYAHFKSDTFSWHEFKHNAYFSGAKFYRGVDFSDNSFQNVWFDKAVFYGDALFIRTEFAGKLRAWGIKFSKNADFEWANFRSKVNLSDTEVKSGKLNLHGVNFEQNAYFYNSQIHELNLKKLVLDRGIFFLNAKITLSNRETFRIIKNEFLKQNNRIEALQYHAREMKAYIKESKSVFDLIILSLNWISNGFGLKWHWGLLFYIFTTWAVFHWFWLTVSYHEDLFYWKEAIKFLSPVHKIMVKDNDMSWVAYAVDALGRIIASFGIYQTIVAFRKFGKL